MSGFSLVVPPPKEPWTGPDLPQPLTTPAGGLRLSQPGHQGPSMGAPRPRQEGNAKNQHRALFTVVVPAPEFQWICLIHGKAAGDFSSTLLLYYHYLLIYYNYLLLYYYYLLIYDNYLLIYYYFSC